MKEPFASRQYQQIIPQKKKDKLKNILSNAKHDGIDLVYTSLLHFKITSKNFNKLEAFHEYVILFSYLIERGTLSQPLLSVLLLNTRFNYPLPQAMEDLKYIADVLRYIYNGIKNWEFSSVDYITDPLHFDSI